MRKKRLKFLSILAICSIAICCGFTAYNFKVVNSSILKYEVEALSSEFNEIDFIYIEGEGWVYEERRSKGSNWIIPWDL